MKTLTQRGIVVVLICVLIVGITSISKTQTETIIFEGYPTIRAVVNGKDKKGNPSPCVTVKIPRLESQEYKCIISKRGNKYYWTSREDKELIPRVHGIYITFLSLGGNGDHITFRMPFTNRLLQPSKDMITYVEHITHGVTSLNYMGSDFTYNNE